jgi:hypothetical protein
METGRRSPLRTAPFHGNLSGSEPGHWFERDQKGVESNVRHSHGDPHNNHGGNTLPNEHWQPRKDWFPMRSSSGGRASASRHGRQKSLSEAFKAIRERPGSVSASAHEIADALKAPVSLRLIVRCSLFILAFFNLMTMPLANVARFSV